MARWSRCAPPPAICWMCPEDTFGALRFRICGISHGAMPCRHGYAAHSLKCIDMASPKDSSVN